MSHGDGAATTIFGALTGISAANAGAAAETVIAARTDIRTFFIEPAPFKVRSTYSRYKLARRLCVQIPSEARLRSTRTQTGRALRPNLHMLRSQWSRRKHQQLPPF